MGSASPSEGRKADDLPEEAVTDDEMLQFVSGQASDDTKRRIAAHLDDPNSRVRRWLAALGKATENPFDIDLKRILEA